MRHEVMQLLFLIHFRPVKMVGADLEPIVVGKVYVLLVFVVYPRTTFRGLEVDIRHFAFSNGLPKHRALIMAQVYAVNMPAGVLAFHAPALRERRQADDCEKKDKRKTFHAAKIHTK